MKATGRLTLTKEELQEIISTFSKDSEDHLPGTYPNPIYRYDEQPA
jgi:hypothetical protein